MPNNNTYKLAGGLNITNGEPVDSRILVSSTEELYSGATWSGVPVYNGMIVGVADGKLFTLKDKVKAISTLSADTHAAWEQMANAASVATVASRISDIQASFVNLLQVLNTLDASISYKTVARNVTKLNDDGYWTSSSGDPDIPDVTVVTVGSVVITVNDVTYNGQTYLTGTHFVCVRPITGGSTNPNRWFPLEQPSLVASATTASLINGYAVQPITKADYDNLPVKKDNTIYLIY